MTDRLTLAQADLVAAHHAVATGLAVRARRRWPHGDPAAILSDAFLGLIDAAGRWDPDGKAAFRTFARPRVWGAIIDGYRQRHGRHGQKVELLTVDDPDMPIDIPIVEPGFDEVDEALSLDEVPWLPLIWTVWDRRFHCLQCHTALDGQKRSYCDKTCQRRFDGGSLRQGPAREWRRKVAV